MHGVKEGLKIGGVTAEGVSSIAHIRLSLPVKQRLTFHGLIYMQLEE